ncbi:MAG: hypothetical protein CMA05_04695 [Euryarchaeota archaeon]|nr:hypothetical protein [Euryarchaeota archaeon]|tara:strand:- start:338 stop:628 length:291 start_codon:yes stop_codon:yes gene_type:complete
MDKETSDSPVDISSIDDTTLDVTMSVENAPTNVEESSVTDTNSSTGTGNGVTPLTESAPSAPSQRGGVSVKNFLHSAKEKWNNVPQGWMQSRKVED